MALAEISVCAVDPVGSKTAFHRVSNIEIKQTALPGLCRPQHADAILKARGRPLVQDLSPQPVTLDSKFQLHARQDPQGLADFCRDNNLAFA
jgi:hypothetical protein